MCLAHTFIIIIYLKEETNPGKLYHFNVYYYYPMYL